MCDDSMTMRLVMGGYVGMLVGYGLGMVSCRCDVATVS